MAISEPKTRTPDREKRATATVSLTWNLYDRLDKIAVEENTSIAKVVEGLLNHLEKSGTKK